VSGTSNVRASSSVIAPMKPLRAALLLARDDDVVADLAVDHA